MRTTGSIPPEPRGHGSPIYVLPNDKYALVSGVLPTWMASRRKSAVGIFVGTALDLSVAKP